MIWKEFNMDTLCYIWQGVAVKNFFFFFPIQDIASVYNITEVSIWRGLKLSDHCRVIWCVLFSGEVGEIH